MHEGKRPGGLTALAVFNFIGTGIDFLGLAGILVMMAFGDLRADAMEREARNRAVERAKADGRDPATAEISPNERQQIAVRRAYESGINAIVQVAGIALCGGLLLAAGVGYLRQRRWGRIVGNIYVVCSVASAIHAMGIVPAESGGGFRFAALIGFVYPALTLYLANVTFREDLTR
jgi:hypothetical protein